MINKKSKTNRRKVLLIIKLALVLALGHVIIKTAVMPQRARVTLSPNTAGGSENHTAVNLPAVSDAPAPDYSAILERDLFGGRDTESNQAKALADERVVIAPQSEDDELGIALLGTVAGSPVVSRAIIKDLKTNVLGQYRTGDTIQTASIHSIEKDRVVLLHRGRRKVLDLRAKEFAASEAGSGRSTATVQAKASEQAGIKPPMRPLNAFADKIRHTAIMLPKAKVEPHCVAGEVEGLRISDLDNIGGAEDLGLRDGDVIRAVNGHRLNSKQKAFQIAMKARSQAALDIELMRDDEIKKFSLPLK
ncbi:MAG: hypothetical protein JSW59_11260 [Phycisphaerales bacterium]|nr:MAG: hypothetical protein JSW59_11260 [Phycisphaerales bacterium]